MHGPLGHWSGQRSVELLLLRLSGWQWSSWQELPGGQLTRAGARGGGRMPWPVLAVAGANQRTSRVSVWKPGNKQMIEESYPGIENRIVMAGICRNRP